MARRKPPIAVSDSRGVRMLHVGGEAIQSAMRLDDPFALALDYTRCMMSFLLFVPQPRDALMIGLGGGSLAKFFHRRLRQTRVRAVELDARIVQVARAQFALPANDARLRVEVGDGREALSPECCDVLLLDAFDDERHVQALATQAFYDAAFLALREPGAMVVNFMDDDPKFDQSLERLERAFGGAVLAMKALYDPNVVAIALRGGPPRLPWRTLHERARVLQERLGLPFPKYVSRLRGLNQGTAAELIIAP
ncbi:MAG TPA: fused MFS/spermidine synthase [Burkholderiales bacterium]|nr:fused MFS/spermidine synthase [Burkholderiales bacterium]